MPVKQCMKNGKNGYKWGESGECYIYESEKDRKEAYEKARKQGVAILISEKEKNELHR